MGKRGTFAGLASCLAVMLISALMSLKNPLRCVKVFSWPTASMDVVYRNSDNLEVRNDHSSESIGVTVKSIDTEIEYTAFIPNTLDEAPVSIGLLGPGEYEITVGGVTEKIKCRY